MVILIVTCVLCGFTLALLGGVQFALGSTAFALHASLMITAWSVLMPAGGIVARYFKVTPRQNYPAEVENLFWWDWHRILQYSGLALATVAFAVMLHETTDGFSTWHGRFGLFVMLVGWAQLVSTWFRGDKGGPTGVGADPNDPATWRGDHYDMTRRRRAFEAWHKTAGWTVLAVAGVTVLLGLDMIEAPAWLWSLVGLLQAAAVLGVVDGRLRHRWVDTYHSLWSPDPRHPGNRAGDRSAIEPSQPKAVADGHESPGSPIVIPVGADSTG